MKAVVLFVAILGLALLVLPMISLYQAPPEVHAPSVPLETEPDGAAEFVAQIPDREPDELEAPADSIVEEEEDTVDVLLEEGYPPSDYGVDFFTVLDESTGELHTVPVRDYVRGAVAAEMPASFHQEALKAQAVAAHTYAVYNHWLQRENPDPELLGADFAADPSNRRGYMTQEQAIAFLGENGERHWQTICRAVDSVLPLIMEYDDEPIVAAYHAMSAGWTEDAGNVWLTGAPYLVPVESVGDLLAPNYESKANFTVEEVRAALLDYNPAMDLSDDPGTWFGMEDRSGSGYITSVKVGGVELHGKELRQIFDLRSHNIDITYNEDTDFTFFTYGYGHGVGLSQYGADYLARQGMGFEEILGTYYSGVVLKQVEWEALE